ncbi:DUF4339 domain-containing protein [Shewanella gaetbuli]|uniref:DUF4339 domain-containing protein n=1 Tax=Shewanella gaetbuli TaxID=220752 RepID=A0A9X1ZGN3_9GAMM|nr:DUF4339 domain-containing protein [Shewanella gaetbuli]MCL1141974.1 DUF4339 domain-containing protein [Shewanella gaetbuli]
MKKWFFSHDGDVTGPLNESEALEFLQHQPNCYGWHPSFSQWLPVSHISEFAGKVAIPESPAQIPPTLIKEFSNTKQSIRHKLTEMDESIKYSKTYLYELEQEINIYKRLTNKLSDEVKNNINGIEAKYESYQKLFAELLEAVEIAKTEMLEVTTEFDARLEARAQDLAAVPTPAKNIETEVAESADSPAIDAAIVAELSSDPVATITTPLDPVATKSTTLDAVATTSASLDPIATKSAPLDPIASPSLSLDPVATPMDNVAEIRPKIASLDPQPIRPGASMDNVAVRLKPGESVDDISLKKSQEKADNNQLSDEVKNAIEQKLEKVLDEAPAADNKSTTQANTEKTETAAKKPAITESPAKLQGVTSILKSVFRGDKKVEPKKEVNLDSPVTLAHSNDAIDDEDSLEIQDKTGTDGAPASDKEGRMRRRSRRRR